jgi:hypothetical protein
MTSTRRHSTWRPTRGTMRYVGHDPRITASAHGPLGSSQSYRTPKRLLSMATSIVFDGKVMHQHNSFRGA